MPDFSEPTATKNAAVFQIVVPPASTSSTLGCRSDQLLKGGGFPHLRRNLAIEFAAESQKLMPSDGLADFNFSRRKLTNRLLAKSK